MGDSFVALPEQYDIISIKYCLRYVKQNAANMLKKTANLCKD